MQTLKMIAEAGNTSLHWLLTGEGSSPKTPEKLFHLKVTPVMLQLLSKSTVKKSFES